MVIERNPLKCEQCSKYVEADDFCTGYYSDVLRGDIYTYKDGKIKSWICPKCKGNEDDS